MRFWLSVDWLPSQVECSVGSCLLERRLHQVMYAFCGLDDREKLSHDHRNVGSVYLIDEENVFAARMCPSLLGWLHLSSSPF